MIMIEKHYWGKHLRFMVMCLAQPLVGKTLISIYNLREEWEGQFVDIVGIKSIPDKSVLRAQQVTPLRQKVSAEKMNIIDMLL